MKKFIDSLELRWSDLFLLIGFIPFAVFLIFGQLFMQYQDPSQVALPLWAMIVCFIVMVGAWGTYLYLEIVKNKTPFNIIIAEIISGLLILGIITIFVQPQYSGYEVIARTAYDTVDPVTHVEPGTLFYVSEYISWTHKIMFAFQLTGIALFIFIGLFIFPKRLRNIKFIEFLGYAIFALLAVLIVYSIATEYNNYIGFFKYIFNKDRSVELENFAVKSFILHKNAFGMIYMIAIIFCFINQSIRPRVWYYPLAGVSFVLMIFTECKTGILLSAVVIFLWLIYRLVVTYKEHRQRNLVTFIVLGALIVFGLIFVGIPYLTKGKFLGKIYDLIKSIVGEGRTVATRTYIWENVYTLIGNGWWVLGRGFGVINTLLLQINAKTHNDYVFPTHSSWLNMLSQGGLLQLLVYIAFIIYCGYVAYKAYKKSPNLTFAIFLGALSFFIYSFIETIHYLLYAFMFPIFVIYFSENKKEEAKNELN